MISLVTSRSGFHGGTQITTGTDIVMPVAIRQSRARLDKLLANLVSWWFYMESSPSTTTKSPCEANLLWLAL